jgi:hypothetical protein
MPFIFLVLVVITPSASFTSLALASELYAEAMAAWPLEATFEKSARIRRDAPLDQVLGAEVGA